MTDLLPSNELQLELTAFQGPFDLLLHLIKELKIDINDIPMAEITQQYLYYVENMQELDLDQVGDYLVMAATLLEIKSRLLLPVEPEFWEDEDSQQDPRQVLVQQLLVYQEFQYVADALQERQELRNRVYARPSQDLSSYQDFVPLESGEISLEDILSSMQKVIERQLLSRPSQKQIHQDPVSVTDKIEAIHQCFASLRKDQRLSFAHLLTKTSRPEIIATFMAVLEMVRKQLLIFHQASPDQMIEIQWKGEHYA